MNWPCSKARRNGARIATAKVPAARQPSGSNNGSNTEIPSPGKETTDRAKRQPQWLAL